MKSLFEFSDYKAYLNLWIKQQPKKGRGFMGVIARALHVNSTFVSHVLSGEKDFSNEQAHALSDLIGLNTFEKDYFLILHLKNRAGTHSLIQYYEKKLDELRKKSKEVSQRIPQDRKLTSEEMSLFYSSWHYTAIRLFCSIGNGKSLDEIKKFFRLDLNELKKIIDFLLEAKLLESANGLFTMGPQKTHVDRTSPYVKKHHSNWRIRSLQQMDHLTDEELMFTAPFSVSKKDFADIREMILTMISQVSKKVGESDADEVAFLNIDLMRLKE